MMASAALMTSQAVEATVVSASSTGYGAAIDLDLLGLDLKVNPLPKGASGEAPGPYDVDKSFLNISTGGSKDLLGLGLIDLDLSLPVLKGSAYSNVDGSSGDKTTGATGGIGGLKLGANLLGGLIPVVDLGLGALSAEAEVTGDYGHINASGASNIADLTLKILGLNIVPHIDLDAAPNTKVDLLGLLGLTGVEIVINEQLVNGDPDGVCLSDSCSLEVNALRLSFNSFPIGIKLLDGDIRLGHAYADMLAAQLSPVHVPIPAAGWLFGSGVIALVGRRRRAKNKMAV